MSPPTNPEPGAIPHDPVPDELDPAYVAQLVALDEARRDGANAQTVDLGGAPRLRQAQAVLGLLDEFWNSGAAAHRGSREYAQLLQSLSGAQPLVRSFIGRFEIRRHLGHGGMGTVFLAFDARLDREVAIKIPRLEVLLSPQSRQRFLVEGRAAALLNHPNVMPIFEAGEENDLCFLVMPFCRGPNLADWLAGDGSAMALEVAARLVLSLANAVQHAHDRGILHRDLKPANVLLEPTAAPGQAAFPFVPLVTDFGLAKLQPALEEGPLQALPHQRAEAGLTASATTLGTPSYMAPELAQGKSRDVGPAADVYALGAILYELLTGRPPFQAASAVDTMMQVIAEEPVAPRRLQSRTPRDLETVCLKCLDKEPSRRYASAGALAEDLRLYQRGEPILARPIGALERLGRWCRRRPAAAALALVSLAALGTILGLSVWFIYRLAGERGKTALAELQRIGSEKERAAAEEMARTQEYFALLMKARERIASADTGWPDEALALVEQTAALRTSARQPAQLRSAAAACLASTSLRLVHKLPADFLVSTVAFHPDGGQLALGEAFTVDDAVQLRVRLVAFPSGTLVREFTYPASTVSSAQTGRLDGTRSLAFSPDGRWLAVGARHADVHIWDLSTPGEPTTLAGAGWNVVFSQDSRRLYADGNKIVPFEGNGMLTCWDVASKFQLVCRVHRPGVNAMAPGPGRTLVVQASHVAVLDGDTLGERYAVPMEGYHFAAGADGGTAFINRQSSPVRVDLEPPVWSSERSEWSHRFAAPRSIASQGMAEMYASPDGRLLLTKTGGRSLYLWEVATGEPVAEWPVPEGTGAASFHPTGQWLAVATNREVHVLEVRRFDEHRALAEHILVPEAIGCSPDGQVLATVSRTSDWRHSWRLTLWNANREAPPRPIHVHDFEPSKRHSPKASIAFHPATPICAFAGFADLERIDLQSLQVLSSERLLRPRAVVYHPSSHALWIAQAANLLVLPDDARFERKFTWQNPYGVENEGESLALDVTENIAAVGDENGQVHVFNSRLPTESGPLAPVWTKVLNDRIEMRSVAISPDERYIVVGDRMGNLFRIDARSQALRQHVGHRHFITGLRFVTDEIFASSSRDGTVRFWRWQLDAPEELFHLSLGGPVLDISFSRDRRLLAVQVEGQAGTHFWHLDALWQRFASLDVPLAAPPAWNQGR